MALGATHGSFDPAPGNRRRDGDRRLIWWLAAAASGRAAYDYFMSWAGSPLGYVVMIGLSWAFFEHMLSGLRHFVLDIGAGYELSTNKTWALVIPVIALVLTAALWLWILAGKL
jgi:succinate dehydrogenase / fumarate reductase cytochrome b subunit